MADGRQANPHSRRPNYSYIEEQNEARTDLLNSKVSQLKHLAVQIGEETKFQNKYLKVRTPGCALRLTIGSLRILGTARQYGTYG